MTQKKIFRICGIISGVSGLVVLLSAAYPLVSYEIESRTNYPSLISPVVRNKTLLDGSLLDTKDLTKASNWFESGNDLSFSEKNINSYEMTIPKLRIKNAKVSIGGEDLSESLIHYPGTADPGFSGNSVVFGHSILPIFYDPENYLAIFSTLNKLEEGDDIFVTYDSITYHYKVQEKFEVRPTDVQILDQVETEPFLSLVTCTPPGHPAKPKRLVVRAKMIFDLSFRN